MTNFADYEPEVPPLPGRSGGGVVDDDWAEDSPSRFLWLFCLFLRPGVFFRHFVVESPPAVTALCAWLYGMSGVIDRIETQLLTGRSLGFGESWLIYWSIVTAVGAMGGVVYFAIGGWWFRIRLQWAGAQAPDAGLARRVYLYASQVVVLPTLVTTVWETGRYSTPIAAFNAEASWWYLALLLFPFWSCWTSYVGTRTAFEVRRVGALVWFFILPSLFYVVFLGGVLVGGFAGAQARPPNLDQPRTHNSATMTFRYPGNWWIDECDEDYDPTANVFVEPMQDAWIHIMIYESDQSVEEELQATFDGYDLVSSGPAGGEPFETWGMYHGLGGTLRGTMEGVPVSFRAFVTCIGNGRYLEINECGAVGVDSDVRPGFELIRSTFRIEP